MEFYFSAANLHKDRFLKQQLEQSSDGCKIIFMLFNILIVDQKHTVYLDGLS